MRNWKSVEKASRPLLSLCAIVLASCGGNNNTSSPPAVPIESGLDQRPSNVSCIAPPRPGSSSGLQLDLVFPNLTFTRPVSMQRAPGDNTRWFVLQQSGSVVSFANDNTTSAKSTFVDLAGLVSGGTGEDGLLGMAFHPQYASNRQVFLSYTRPGPSPFPLVSYISRFTANAAGTALGLASEQPILTLNQPYSNHNGGHIAFSPNEPYLYIGLGDGGSSGDPDNNAQNPNNFLGKMLRIDVDSASPYGIPADNPFATGGGAREIYALGLRNPWRWSFDRATGDLWLGDVGQNMWEEVDKITRGGNYGWRIREGMHCFGPSNCTLGTLIDPDAEYEHIDGACSITGGFVYRGTLLSDLQDTYVYGDFCNGKIWGINVKNPGATPRLLIDTPYNISSFGEDENGELYVVSHSNGKLYRLVLAGTPAPGLAQKLSATGCMDPANPALPASGLIPYDVNVPFWSDGAAKTRWLALPDNTSITVGSDGDWTFPIGTVLVKHFRLGGKLIETRLFMRHPDGEWAGYSYEWDAAETDATLLTTGKVSSINGQSWLFPSGDQCLQCHTAAAGRALGPETAQMNRSFTYPGGRSANQIATFKSINLFGPAQPPAVALLPALPQLTDITAALDTRARAYLHSNCSFCHRPGGTGQGPMDFRYTTADANTNVCNTQPTQGDLGVVDARLVYPGNPAKSIVSVRMHRLDNARMPPVASSVLDSQGTTLIDGWIAGLTTCRN